MVGHLEAQGERGEEQRQQVGVRRGGASAEADIGLLHMTAVMRAVSQFPNPTGLLSVQTPGG